jgi:DNA-directed RNA polymerase specialized sigma24 family protein
MRKLTMPAWIKELTTEIKARLMPFLMLLDSRYLPLILVESYQSFTVYLWLWDNSPKTGADAVFSVLGGASFTAIYVGVIAWAEKRQYNGWVIVTAATALVFGVSVAITHFIPRQGWAALLHAGFPLVGFMYTLAMHGAPAPRNPIRALVDLVNSRSRMAEAFRSEMNNLAHQLNEARTIARKAWAEREQMATTAQRQARELEQAAQSYQAMVNKAFEQQELADKLAVERSYFKEQHEQAQRELERAMNSGDLDRRALAQAMNNAGMTVRQIAGLLNVSTGTVSNLLKPSNGRVPSEVLP